MSEYERGAEAMRGAARRRVQEWILTYSNVEPGAEVRTALSRLRSEIDALALPTPPAPDAEPKPDAVAKKRPRKDASAVLREIEDFLGHIAMNGADAKDREVALALEQDAHVLAAKPDAVAAARERFRDAAALAVIASITSAGSDQDERIKKAAWQTARTFFDAMREATEQAEREGGQA